MFIKKLSIFLIFFNLLNCAFAIDDIKELPSYANLYSPSDFPEKTDQGLHLKSLDLQSPSARLFRTRLKEAAKEAPNFSGNMVVATWGCGSGCLSFAFVNLKTGKVWFPDFDMFFSTDEENYNDNFGYYYWPNSSLFVAIGSKNGWEDKPGVYYYQWTGQELKLLKAVTK